MKKLLIILLCSILSVNQGHSQAAETQQLIINWQKLNQLRQILDNMYWGYKVLDRGYTTIKKISEGNYTLHQLFFDGLMAVNPAVRNYKRIPYIIDYQKLLLKEYKRAYSRFREDPGFKPEELRYLGHVYSFLVKASLQNIDELIMVITATKLRMTDDERMQAIDRIFYDMENKVVFLRTFNNSTQLLAIQRARSRNDVRTMQQLYRVN